MPLFSSCRIRHLVPLLLIGLATPPEIGVCASPHLVLDINQTPGTNGTADSNPSDFVNFGGHLVFTADDGVHGRELWQSDSTAAGTRMIVDLLPGPTGSKPNNLFVANGLLYFFASDEQGVSHLMALAPGGARPVTLAQLSGNACTQPAVLGGKLFFAASASADISAPTELWTSDGTPGGTIR